MLIRLSHIVLVAAIGLYMALVVFNNLSDYGSNFDFVSHVLSMDDTFADNAGRWRAIPMPMMHHFAYIGIILTEIAIASLCMIGFVNMWKNRKSDIRAFQAAHSYAIGGLLLGIVLWFVGFVSIGGEWFLMWQSSTWNGTEVAMRNALLFSVILVYITRDIRSDVQGSCDQT